MRKSLANTWASLQADDTKSLKNLLDYIQISRGTDFSRYRQATIRRMLDRRMQDTGQETVGAYFDYLQRNPEEIQHLLRSLTVKVSSFFRNPLSFEIIQAMVIPDLVQNFGAVTAWSIGCANGEEPYSLAIILRELIQKERMSFTCRIIASDMDANALKKAKRAEYTGDTLDDVKKKQLDAYFEPVSRSAGYEHTCTFRLKKEITDMVCFSCGDMEALLRNEASGRFNLILCRNVLIYMNLALQHELLDSICGILYPKGYLMLGESETLPSVLQPKFLQPFPGVKIYQKKSF